MANAQRINDWDQLYPGRFFKGGDIPEGAKKVVTISGVELEELEGDNGLKAKGILTFEGEKMQLALNKTNGICLREMFGRKPYEWVGKRFAMFQSEWQQEPCVRIWGSPDISEDISVQIDLGRRRKPFRMTMHAMRAERPRSNRPPARGASVAKAEPLGDRAQELLKLMQKATTVEELMDIEADADSETFNDRESRVLQKAMSKRREQLSETGDAPEKDDDDAIPFK